MGRCLSHKAISRLLLFVLVLGLLTVFPGTAYAAEEKGTCGERLTWTFSDGCLTVSGSGEMEDFPEDTMAPWYPLREEIRTLSLPEGMTSLGNLAFYGCKNLTAVTVPESVQSIGSYAFTGCTGMMMLKLGKNVSKIGTSAFSDCTGLTALILPDSLESIGEKAFYRCESIPTVTIPTSVQWIGQSAFGYCKNLVSARVEAQMEALPNLLFYGCHQLTAVKLPDALAQLGDFTFRGCDQLVSVSYAGDQCSPEVLQEWIGKDVASFQGTGYMTDQPVPDRISAGETAEQEDGSYIQKNTTVIQRENVTATVKTDTRYQENGTGVSASLDISLTVENEQGWEDVKEILAQALKDYNANTAQLLQKKEQIHINLYVREGKTEMAELIAQRNISVTVFTQDGSRWKLEGQRIAQTDQDGDLRYTLSSGTREQCKALGAEQCYVLRFHSDSQIPAEVLLPLGAAQARKTATLLTAGKPATQLQSSVVDGEGNVHLYLAAVSAEQDYYIALQLPEIEQEPIVPDELLDSYGRPIRHTPIEYQIIGVKSSMGVTLGQFTGLLIGGMIVTVAVVGITVYLLFRRKNRKGASGTEGL